MSINTVPLPIIYGEPPPLPMPTKNTVGSYLVADTPLYPPIVDHSAPTFKPVITAPVKPELTVGEKIQREVQKGTSTLKNELETGRQQFKQNWGEMGFAEKANTIAGTVNSLWNTYNSYKMNKLAEKQFNHAVATQTMNQLNQAKMTDSRLEDRQRRRVIEAKASGREVESVSDYMRKYSTGAYRG